MADRTVCIQGAADHPALVLDQLPMGRNRLPDPADRVLLNRHLKGILGTLETVLGDGGVCSPEKLYFL
jgi:hypothetical protein